MPLYRTLERLSFDNGRVVKMDVVDPLKGVPQQVITALLQMRRISEVQAPPLRVLPGWKERAAVLEPLGIKDVSQLVTADLDKVAKELGVSAEGLRRAVLDAQQWLMIEEA